MNSRQYVRASVLCVFALITSASAIAAANVKVTHAWARASAPGQTTAVVYLDLKSDTDAALTSAKSTRAERVELHAMSMDNGVMRMRPVERVELPAAKTVNLAPNGTHLMLVNVKEPLKAGERVPLTLTIAKAGHRPATVKVQAEVRSLHDAHHH